MQDEVRLLIDKANSIIQKTGHGPGIRYPQKLKDIITSLVNDHKLSVRQVTKNIPISQFSAREWPKNSKVNFKKVTVKKEKRAFSIKNRPKKEFSGYLFFILSVQALLLAFQIFLK